MTSRPSEKILGDLATLALAIFAQFPLYILSMPKIEPDEVDEAYARWNNGEAWSKEDLRRGINEEFEHGKRTPETNVTNDDLETTTKIAVAHLRERDDFYDGLAVVESAPRGYWRGRAKTYMRDHQIAAIIISIMIMIALYETIINFISGETIKPIFWAGLTGILGWILIKIT